MGECKLRLEHSEELGLCWYIGYTRSGLLLFPKLNVFRSEDCSTICEEAKHLGPNTLMHQATSLNQKHI